MTKTSHELFTDQRVHFLEFKGQLLTLWYRAQVTQRYVRYVRSTAKRTYASNTYRCAGPKEIQSIRASVCPAFPNALYLKN